MTTRANIDVATVDGFGDEWERFDQSALTDQEREQLFQAYFHIFPWEKLPDNAQGFDLGCGSGRWAVKVAPRVGRLHCIDPSSALDVARRNLSAATNCDFHSADVETIPLENGSMDFGYSLGVLHHIPDTYQALCRCVEKLRPGAPFLLYLYYAFDNRPWWFRKLWKLSEIGRSVISKMPHGMRYSASQMMAHFVYWPLARGARLFEKLGVNVANFPLSMYRSCSFYTMKTDALDRFGTRLEQRFTRTQIQSMMERAGLNQIRFSECEPYWGAIGFKDDGSGSQR
jgi:ubiquinone/menaquinone biosynthesis C-methylase UbiE